MRIPFPEPWQFEKDLHFTFTSKDFRHRRAMILKVERNIKTPENRGKELYNVRKHFSPICCQKCERQCSNNDLLPA